MTGAFLSELLKLRRRGLLLGGGGLLLGFTALFTVLGIERATAHPAAHERGFRSASASSVSAMRRCRSIRSPSGIME